MLEIESCPAAGVLDSKTAFGVGARLPPPREKNAEHGTRKPRASITTRVQKKIEKSNQETGRDHPQPSQSGVQNRTRTGQPKKRKKKSVTIPSRRSGVESVDDSNSEIVTLFV